MATSGAREAADYLAANFPLDGLMDVQTATEWAFRQLGRSSPAAFEEADERTAAQVRRLLVADRRAKFRFSFSSRDADRMIGNRRVLRDDPEDVREAKAKANVVGSLQQAIYELGATTFEMICAGSMALSGAEANANCGGDEGGIDVYGRIPIRPGAAQGPLTSTFLEKKLLFLGQCKCLSLDAAVGPDDVRDLHGAVELCLRKYQGAKKLPSHRVPESYYLFTETCLKVLFTTAEVSAKAREIGTTLDIHFVTGLQLAEFLANRSVGLGQRSGSWIVDKDSLANWAAQWDSRQRA